MPHCFAKTGSHFSHNAQAHQKGRGCRKASPIFLVPAFLVSDANTPMARPPAPPPDTVTPGPRNLVSPAGLEKLRAELKHLWGSERPKVVEAVSRAAANGDRSENGDYIYGKKRLREIDRRVRFLTKRLDCAEVVDPTQQKNRSRVFFGATVVYINDRDEEVTVTILGQDEADLTQGSISWLSPVARALMKAQVGDVVPVQTPAGADHLEIIAIHYPS
ncbi:transcription elongation factor GreB [Insolitispirillum peregrinum]|uniref:Transcription elongation factor GreB n=2 Tax=Insolitispirillum peregrinum TaxID=80876 RepID=A0A1N7ITP6_9PROT|nr:transcription elongation factor GreB [Insolitispirillum peregrinum]